MVTLPVYVNNNTEDAVNARTFFLVEEVANNWVHCVENSDVGNTQWVKEGGSDMMIYIDGVKYVVGVFTYDAQLAAGETSAPSIYQWFMDKETEAGVEGLEDGVQIKFISEISAEEFAPVTSEYVASLFGGSVQ